jgi:hypothetical protein
MFQIIWEHSGTHPVALQSQILFHNMSIVVKDETSIFWLFLKGIFQFMESENRFFLGCEKGKYMILTIWICERLFSANIRFNLQEPH